MRAAYPCFLIAPKCRTMRNGLNAPWDKKTGQPLPEKMSDSMNIAVGILDEFSRRSRPIRIASISRGFRWGLWHVGPRRTDAKAIRGGRSDLWRWRRYEGRPPRRPAALGWHGDQDPAVPVERSRQMIEAIKKAGGKPKYTELPGVGHDSWTKAYTDPQGAIPWMFEQRKASK